MRYILDTNVVSEAMKESAEASVLSWFEENQGLYVFSAVTVAEIEKGIELLPEGRRKLKLQSAYRTILPNFDGKVLAFDLEVARRWALLAAELRRQGRQTPVMDSMIEATALVWGLTVVTRNISDFIQAPTLNPWKVRA